MKRITLWFLSTVSAVVLLFGYHTSTSAQLTAAAGTAYTASRSTSTASGTASGTASSPAPSSETAGSGAGSAPGDATTVTGDVAQTQWGPVQVELTVAGGKVTDVSVVQYPSGNPKDEEINAYALPVLVDETIQAQSAEIDMVSGATVTSVGYLQSLQSALDQASL